MAKKVVDYEKELRLMADRGGEGIGDVFLDKQAKEWPRMFATEGKAGKDGSGHNGQDGGRRE
jgi:hypothetical protein